MSLLLTMNLLRHQIFPMKISSHQWDGTMWTQKEKGGKIEAIEYYTAFLAKGFLYMRVCLKGKDQKIGTGCTCYIFASLFCMSEGEHS